MRHTRPALALLLAVIPVFAARAQARPRSTPNVTPAEARALSDLAYTHGDTQGALDHALAALALDSNDVGALWRAARSEVTLGIITSRIHEENQDARYDRAIAWGRRATRLEEGNAMPHFWLAAALGRRAMHADFRPSAQLAAEAFAEARRALAIDSSLAGAHEVLGKLNSEVRKLPWVIRALVSTFTGFSEARSVSWASAQTHLERAIALDPSLLLARLDLAELYLRMDNRSAADKEVDSLLAATPRTPLDRFVQDEGRRLRAR